MGKGRDSKDETARKKDNGESKNNNGQSRKEDGALEDSREEENRIENDENEQGNDEHRPLEHSLGGEINKSRRSNLDEKSSHIIDILEKKRSDRDAEQDIPRNGQRTLLSSKNEEKKYSNSNNEDDTDEIQRPLSTINYYAEETSVSESEDPDQKALKELHDQVNSIGDENKADQKISDQETNNSEDEKFVQAFNADASDEKNEQNPKSNEDAGEISVYSNRGVLNRSLERVQSVKSVKSEKDLFFNPNQERKSTTVVQDLTLNNESMNEEEVLVNNNQDASDRKPEGNLNKKEEPINPKINSFDGKLKENSYECEKETFENNPVNTYAERENDAWNKESQQGLNKDEKEILVNGDEQRGSFRLSNSKSYMPNHFIRNEKETSDNQGYNLNSKKSDNKFINPNKERVIQPERGSAVKFNDLGIDNDKFDEKRARGSDDKTPVNNMCLSPEKNKMIDIVLRSSHEDNNSSSLKTRTMKTENTIDETTESSSTPVQRKKEVIKINKELAPAVILLLKKLEQCQTGSKSASQITPNKTDNILELKRQKSLDNSAKGLKQNGDPNKDMPEGPEPKKRESSTDNLKLLNGDRRLGEIEGAQDISIITIKSSRATSTSTLEQPYCSSSKCQRTCKRCKEVKRINQEEDSPYTRRGNRQEDFNIAPTLEAITEKCKNVLKVGCSLLRNVYYNQNLVRVYYFQTHPGGGDMDEEL